MSQENVEVVQAIYKDLLAPGRVTDPANLGRFQELFDPGVELQQLDGFLGTTGTFRGYEGLLSATREQVAVWDDFHIIAEQHFEAGDSVVTAARGRGRGRGSGVEVDMRVGHLWVLRAGRVVRWVVYASADEALEAVGLRE
jgi:ketosteroid isomerase-like protein